MARALIAAIQQAVRAEDGAALASLLALERPLPPGSPQLAALVGAAFPEPHAIAPVLAAHFAALHSLAEGGSQLRALEAAFDAEHDALKHFLSLVSESGNNWVVRPLHALINGVYALGQRLERALAAHGQRDAARGRINMLATTLRNAFSVTINHRLPKDQLYASKRWGALLVVNVLFRMYFSLNQLRQCKFLINAVEGPGFPALEPPPAGSLPGGAAGRGYSGFPTSQLVTYRYYTGRLAMFDEDYGRANTSLTYALAHCEASYVGNRRRILDALVPVRLLLGQLPSHALLQRHELQHYAGVVEGVRTGNLAVFTAALAAHRENFIASGVYLLLERLQLYVYRTLFRRVARQAGTPKLGLPLLQQALLASSAAPPDVTADAARAAALGAAAAAAGAPGAWLAPPPAAAMDVSEVECLVANLIHGKFIRGYLSHKPPFLVTARENAFRPLGEVALLGERL